jgi:GLPGLI family protein
MKLFYSLLATVAIAFSTFSQKGFYVKYETSLQGSGENYEMMAMMMNGSTMELAASEERTWVKTEMGTMMTMTMDYKMSDKVMTMLMSGMMGTMAFQGDPDDLADDSEDEEEVDIELTNETKQILKYTCKKAVLRTEDGYEAVYWYTEDFERPEGMEQMPNQIPGLCLEMNIQADQDITMTYTAIEVNEKAKMSDFELVIPDGVEIMSLEDMQNMGM